MKFCSLDAMQAHYKVSPDTQTARYEGRVEHKVGRKWYKIDWKNCNPTVKKIYKGNFIARIIKFLIDFISGSTDNSQKIQKFLSDRNFTLLKAKLDDSEYEQTVTNKNGETYRIERAPPIKKIAISGGGVMGVVLAAYLKVLQERLDILSSVVELAGTSAGAMMSYLLAAGLSPIEIDEELNTINIPEQLKSSKDKKFNQEFKFANNSGLFKATRATKRLHDLAKKSVLDFLANQELDKSSELYDRYQLGFEGGITFNDLKLLHEKWPRKFKRLHVTGYNAAKDEVVYFNDELTPNVPCHIAVRISMSLPKVMKPIRYEGEILSDGGQGSNIPLEIFSLRVDYNQAETLLLAFDKNGETHQMLHYPKRRAGYYGPPPNFFRSLVLGRAFAENQKKDAEKIYSLGVNVLVIPHGSLTTMSFEASPGRIEEAQRKAIRAAQRHSLLLLDRAMLVKLKT